MRDRNADVQRQMEDLHSERWRQEGELRPPENPKDKPDYEKYLRLQSQLQRAPDLVTAEASVAFDTYLGDKFHMDRPDWGIFYSDAALADCLETLRCVKSAFMSHPAGMSVQERQAVLLAAVNADPPDVEKMRLALGIVGNVELAFVKGPLAAQPDRKTLPRYVCVNRSGARLDPRVHRRPESHPARPAAAGMDRPPGRPAQGRIQT